MKIPCKSLRCTSITTPYSLAIFFVDIKMTRGDLADSKNDTVRDLKYFEKYDVNSVVDNELSLKRSRMRGTNLRDYF